MRPPRRRRGSPGSTPADSPATCAATGRCPAPSATGRPTACAAAARAARGTDGVDLVRDGDDATSPTARGDGDQHVVAFDYGIKAAMVDQLGRRFRVTVVPASTTADQVRELGPDGVFLSNGPGDPAALGAQTAVVARPRRRGADLRHLPGPPAPGDRAGGDDLQAGLRPPRQQPPGQGPRHRAASRSRPRTTTTPWRPDSLARGVVSHVNLNDGVIEGISLARGAVLLRPVPPRGRARAPRRALPLRAVRASAAHRTPGGPLMPRRDDLALDHGDRLGARS